ncbi:MAG: molybdopterin biosynthesis protein [Candidatus Brocadia fulgida]|uniref:Molybdopterin biosynthesis protein n=1 Tax=Candidatus Brocadia fulgida TaxID=380242 RepID=A0A0M2UTL2_9BACT|nr:MAG: molybdopterin biosynthesis protein [Candidatus Brocadia fulgida]
MSLSFTEEQIKRYSRHIILPEVGGKGQQKLFSAKVFLVGAGGLGSPAAFYLAAAGIGKIGIADNDCVDHSNLQRQILHSTNDVGRSKALSAKETLEALNPDIEVVPYTDRLNSGNIMDIIKDYDVILDGTDNFPTRYLVNDACVFLKKPLSHGSIFRFEGQVTTIIPFEVPVTVVSTKSLPPLASCFVPGGGSPWGIARCDWLYSGNRGSKADSGERRGFEGKIAHVRFPVNGL